MAHTTDNASADVLDRAGLLERSGGDIEFLIEISQMFVDECPRMLDEIRAACDRGDALALQHAAHTLKGCVANFGARNARDAAARLEAMGRSADLRHAPEARAELEYELSRVTGALLALSEQLSRG